jgi:2-polyprenyl-3-methyl-5-hydroxy-6-metoxy-1,4-benzoquinol methylase
MMKKKKEHWTREMFINRARLWLHWMDMNWKNAPKTARNIKKILGKFGITRGKLLELGCGNGRITINMAKQGFAATGIDISQLYIDEARKRSARMHARTNFILGDIRYIDKVIHEKFDVIISIWTSIGFYDRKTDEIIFKKVSRLLNKKGIFMILSTMTRERIMNIFCPSLYEETDQYIKINRNDYDKIRSIMHNKWQFYKKVKKDLIYVDEFDLDLRIYALPELVDMAERAGLEFKEAYHSIIDLSPVQADSAANIVFQRNK